MLSPPEIAIKENDDVRVRACEEHFPNQGTLRGHEETVGVGGPDTCLGGLA